MKKILCLFAVLLLFVCGSSAFTPEEFHDYVLRSSADFDLFQIRDYKDALNLSENERDEEIAFKNLYSDYINYYNDIIRHFNDDLDAPFDYEYVKKYQKDYMEYGLGFIFQEGSWNLEEDYTKLLNTPEIPKNWAEWLRLQQKYLIKNRKNCIKFAKKGFGCEGGTMTIPEREQAIIDLSKIEQKSDVIWSIKARDFDYIPYTSRELLDTYLMGNDLNPIFEWAENDQKKLNKASKESFEHFIKHHKDSVYWNVVNEYYKKLKQNNFIYQPEINGWLIDELENPKNWKMPKPENKN